MKKNLLAIPAIIFCMHFFILCQAQTPCAPGTPITPGESCVEACINCSFSTYTGTSAGWQGDPQPPGWCSNIQNDQWIGFVASSNFVTITIDPSNCAQGQGLQAALYPVGCDAFPLECNPGCATCGETNTVFSTTSLIPGNVYYLVIDGYSQDQCDFTVTLTPAQNALPIGNPTQISGTTSLCPGSADTFSILPVANAGYYRWESNDPGVLFNGQPGPVTIQGAVGASVEMALPVTAAGGSSVSVCVTPFSLCQTGTQRCKTITVKQTPPATILPHVFVCNEDSTYTLPWGEVVDTSGVYNQGYVAANGCDSIVFQEVTILPALSSTLVSTFCQGDSVKVCDDVYKVSGTYQKMCTSFQGCDSTINLTVNVLAPVASIETPSAPLSCSQPTLTLQSAPSPSVPVASVKTWRNLATGETSTGENLVVTTAGDYELCTSMTLNGVSCSVCDTVTVGIDTSMAFLEANVIVSGPITCLSPATLSATSNMQGTTFTWISAAGSVGVDSIYIAANPGEYVLAAMNGICIDSVTVTVTFNAEPGVATLSVEPITCISPATVSASSNIAGLIYEWVGVDSFEISGPSFTTSVPGAYYLVTTNPANGCTWTGAVMVLENTYAGVTTVSAATLTCDAPTATVNAISDIPGLVYTWTTPTGPIDGQTITVTQSGIYTLVTTNPANGCTATTQATVNEDVYPGTTTLSATPVTCTMFGNLVASSDISGLQYLWVNPDGITVTVPNFWTPIPGIHTLTTTNPANGCTWEGTIELPDNTAPPVVVFTVTNADPGQSNGAIYIDVTGGIPPYTFSWGANGVILSIEQNLINRSAGVYTLEVTGGNGCTTVVSIQIMTTSGTAETELASSFWKVAPNPVMDYMQILWTGEGDAPGASINVFDATGKLVFNIAKPAGQSQLVIPCSQYPAGIYTIEIQPDNHGAKSVIRVNVVH